MNLQKLSRLLVVPAVAILAQSAYGQIPATAAAVMPGPNAPGFMRSHAWFLIAPDQVHGPGQTSCSSGCYYNAVDVQTAYATGSIPPSGSSGGGAGMTVGIVDAYYNSQTPADCAAYAAANSLPPCNLTIVTQTGCVLYSSSPSYVPNITSVCTPPGSNSGWAVETDLDVQAVHSLAPNAAILLVACNNNSNGNLGAGDLYAEANSNVVTNSFGGLEYSSEAVSYDPYLSGSTVPVLFSAGDIGAVTESPCVSIYALCVGGTSLLETATSFRNVEGAWGNVPWVGNEAPGGGGGGCSAYIPAPSFQSGYSTCLTKRGVPDIAALADPATGLYIYLGSFASEDVCGSPCPGFIPVGGTSLASPLTAAVIADIDADRVAHSKNPLGANLNALLYQAAGTGPAISRYRFLDVTIGSTSDAGNGDGIPLSSFSAAAGWDETTGLGVILGPGLATYLLTLP